MQGLFWAGLTALLDEGGYVQDGPAYAKWFGERFRGVLGLSFPSTSLADQVDACRRSLPSHSDWQSAEHEVNLGDALFVAQDQKDVDNVVALSLRLLLSLIARGIEQSPYGTLVAADRFFETYEINLFSLQKLSLIHI